MASLEKKKIKNQTILSFYCGEKLCYQVPNNIIAENSKWYLNGSSKDNI